MGGLVKSLDKELRRFTGVKAQEDAAKRNADAQIAATERAAAAQEQQARDAAKAAADTQSMIAERKKVEESVAALAATPQDTVDVVLASQASTDSAAGAARKRKAKFGVGATGAYIP